MSRCTWTRDYDGVVVGCQYSAGHDDPDYVGPDDHFHMVACVHCAKMVEDPNAEDHPGMRCTIHGVREPAPDA